MREERKKSAFEILLNKLTSNFGRMMLVNLIFAVPFGISLSALYLFTRYVFDMPVIILPLTLVFSSPFLSGVVVLSRELSEGTYSGNLFGTYIKAVKENWRKFLITGVLLYVAVVGCCFSLTVYFHLAQTVSWVFYFLIFISVLICIFFLFFFYHTLLMLPSFDLKLKDVYKNSALATFGEIKLNFFTTLGLAIYLAVVLVPFIVISYLAGVLSITLVEVLLIIYIFIAVLLLIPSPCMFIISHFIYPAMLSVIAGVGKLGADGERVSEPNEKIAEDIISDREDLEMLAQGDADDYVFYKGKMIKRGTLRNLLEETSENPPSV